MGKKETKLTKKIYSENVLIEWNRLVQDTFHKLEFDTTIKYLKKYLPPNGVILDAGGGPGRYSIELAKMGYEIVLLDLVPEHLEFAKKKIKQAEIEDNIKNIITGTITDLSRFDDNSFDAVLCLGGALSHVHPDDERKKAVSELIRVSKRKVPIFVSVMGKLGSLTRFYRWIPEVKNTSHFKKLYLQGDDYEWHGGKAYAHFFELNELRSLFNDKTKHMESIGLEGLATPAEEQINKMAENEPLAWKNWLEMHYSLCNNPAVAEISLHFMVIEQKV